MSNNSQENITNLNDLIKQNKDKEILLPDFQRKFVWKEEDRQIKLIASVLAKMPIGCILLLEGIADNYKFKKIGTKTEISSKDITHKTVQLVLDGQQRLTVLTNVFSNVVLDITKVSELVSPSLKRRFFLKVPKWQRKIDNDVFCVKKLNFPYEDSDDKEPPFLSSDFIDSIVTYSYTAEKSNPSQPYNPLCSYTSKLDSFCLTEDENNYLIPLFLLTPYSEKDQAHTKQARERYRCIFKGIYNGIIDDICSYFANLTTRSEKEEFLKEIGQEELINDEFESVDDNLRNELNSIGETWIEDIKKYLTSCIEKIHLSQIRVSSEKRARAIDIYESLNLGGVCLNTFDLIMARVATVQSESLHTTILNLINKNDKDPLKEHYVEYVPDVISLFFDKKSDSCIQDYNASLFTECILEDDDINSKYLDTFLNVISLFINKKNNSFGLEYTKRNEILNLHPEDIHKNTEKVCIAIERALFFFQTRCGIRKINEINYALMITVVATLFMDDNIFSSKNTHNVLEALYWTSVFSGNYDHDQNTRMINDLNKLYSIFSNENNKPAASKYEYILHDKELILNYKNFSDKELFLMEKAEDQRLPKKVLRTYICQYYLAKTYSDMFDKQKKVSVFMDDRDSLEAHHIIPLGSLKNYGESTKELRKKDSHICNSPINFVYITSAANKEISSDCYDVYIKKVQDEAKSKLDLVNFSNITSSYDEEAVKSFFKERFDHIKGSIKSHVTDLLGV